MASSSEWRPLDPESLVAAPCLIEQTLCCSNHADGQPRLARDVAYATAVLEAWKEQDADATWETEWRSVTYYASLHGDEDDENQNNTPLYGHLVRRQHSSSSSSSQQQPPTTTVGVLLLHTGAGPHDLFLLWKAAALLNAPSLQQQTDIVVLIADLLSDEAGWAWNNNMDDDDSRFYEAARDRVLRVVEEQEGQRRRPVLQSRLEAAVACLQEQLDTSSRNKNNSMAALGWGFGGHAIAELARMRVPTMHAMATFHGVFDGVPTPPLSPGEGEQPQEVNDSGISTCEILICHGVQDPLVPDEDLENALATFQHYYGLTTSLLQLRDAKHGFTNPAYHLSNENPAFAFDRESADKAWRQALALLERRICGSKS